MTNKLATGQARGGLKGAVLGVFALLAVGGLVAAFWPSPDAEALAKRAGDEFMARRFDLAEADLARVGRLRPPTSLDWMLRAQIALVKGQSEEALEALARVPDDYPMAAQARLEAGQVELRRDRYAAAERRFLEALELDPKAVQARRELIYIYGLQLRRGELEATFRALSEHTPLDYSQTFLWCLARGVTWDAREIIETLRKCLRADPTDRWAKLGMAEAYRESSRFDDAEATLALLPASDPSARAARARLALDRGDDQGAEALLADGPADDVDLALLRGRFALAKGDGPEAARQYRIAYQKSPNLREALLGLGQALQSIGDPDAAPLLDEARKHERLNILVQKAAVEKNRDDPALMRDLGEACAAIGRFPEARAWYNLAISRDPLDLLAQDGLRRAKELEARAKAAPR